jgi:hypothetical protein
MRIAPRPGSRASEHAISRRFFLQGVAAAGVGVGGFGRLFSVANAQQATRQQKHVILLWMSGGPSQFETWDPKTGQPTGGPHCSIQTSIPGYRVDEFMPNLARLSRHTAVIRSMTTNNADHSSGSFLLQTGFNPSRINATMPHWLSMAAHELPSPNPTLPAFVNINREQDQLTSPGPGFLGSRYQYLYCPGNGQPPEDLPQMSAEQLSAFRGRAELRERLSRRFHDGQDSTKVGAHEAAFSQMGSLLASSDLFDTSRETARDLERYGSSRFGRDCLLALRLVERGISFVRVQHQNGLAWDKHRRAFESQRHITSEFDVAAGALIDDLRDRGLWDRTLVVMMGEFGRTPEILGQGPPGRNHWTRSWSMSLGGCGVRGGVVVGSTNARGTDIADRPVTIHDLFCTFYHVLGIDPHKELEFEGRPLPLVEDKRGTPVREILPG